MVQKSKVFKDSLEEIEKVKSLYIQEGKTIKEVAYYFNCSTSVIQRFLRKHNIKKPERNNFIPTSEQIAYINSKINEGWLKKDIANSIGIPPYLLCAYLRRTSGLREYSNKLISEKWIAENSALFWYFIGFFTADGHLGTFNTVSLFQKEKNFLQSLKRSIGHTGKFYGNSKCWTINITSALLHAKLVEYGFNHNKRYDAPYVKAPTENLEILFLRGLFDGDGSIYYKYISGRFEGMCFQICTGSMFVKDSIYNLLKKLGLNPTVDKCKSEVGNFYWHISIRTQEGIKKLFALLYKDNIEYKYNVKYIKFWKLIKLLELDES